MYKVQFKIVLIKHGTKQHENSGFIFSTKADKMFALIKFYWIRAACRLGAVVAWIVGLIGAALFRKIGKKDPVSLSYANGQEISNEAGIEKLRY